MKKILFVSLLTGLFTTGCTLDNNALNTVNTAMNVLGQVANGEASVEKTSNNQISNNDQGVCSLSRGWQKTKVIKFEMIEDELPNLHLQFPSGKVVAKCASCGDLEFGNMNKSARVKLAMGTYVMEEDESFQQCGVKEIQFIK